MANIAELERVLTFLEDHPEKHDQEHWFCGTGACLFGHAALLNGYERAPYSHSPLPFGAGLSDVALYAPGVPRRWPYRDDVFNVGRKIFDLTAAEAQLLSAAANTRAEIGLMIKDLANGEDITERWAIREEGPRLLPHAVLRREYGV